jgi:hypothetical protein
MKRKAIISRIAISMAVGLLVGGVISELSFWLLPNVQTRPPERVELVIPAGTAEQVARGEAPPSLPADLVFVLGDTLVVKNEDGVTHRLGPLVIPAGTTASLQLREQASQAWECSFQPGNYVGMDVREPLNLSTRLLGIFYAGIPLGVLIAIYSLAAPSQKKSP